VGLCLSKCACYGSYCAIPCEACFISEEYIAAKRSSPHWQILDMGENQVYIELVPVANGTGTATVHGESTTLLCASCLAAYI
jgi:hypothetical protein